MTLKTLVTGVAAAAVVAAAAGGVTSIASSASSGASSTTAAVQPVVWASRCRRPRRPSCSSRWSQTLNGLAGPGSFSGAKGTYIEGGLGRFESIAADREYNKAAQQGYFPLTFVVADIDSGRHDRHGKRHRDGGNTAVPPRPSRVVRRGTEPERMADLEAVRPGPAVVVELVRSPGSRTHRCTHPGIVLSAVTSVAALGLAGCGDDRAAGTRQRAFDARHGRCRRHRPPPRCPRRTS